MKAILLLAGLGFLGCASRRPVTVIVTTDAGCETDDQWAIAYLGLLHEAKEIRLLCVVTTHAPNLQPPESESSAEVARAILATLRLSSAPAVIKGASSPMQGALKETEGAQAIVEAARSAPEGDPLKLVSIGAATDIGMALTLAPEIATKMEVIAMAFEGSQGGDPWNVKNDPAAFKAILDSNVPLTIGPADTCLRHLTRSPEDVEQLTHEGGVVGRKLAEAFRSWIEREPEL